MFLSIEAFFTAWLLAILRWRALLRWVLAGGLLIGLALGPLLLLALSEDRPLAPPEDPSAWAQATLRGRGPLDLWSVALLGFAAAVFAQTVVLQGGLIDSLTQGRGSDARGFFGSCGELWFRSIRAAVIVASAMIAWSKLVGELWIRLSTDPPYEGALRAAHGPGVVILLGLGLVLLTLLFDSATVALASERRSSSFLALVRAVSIWGRRPLSTAILVLLEVAGTLGIGVGAWTLWQRLPGEWPGAAKVVVGLAGGLLVGGWWRLQLLAASGVLSQRTTGAARITPAERPAFHGYSELPATDIRDI